MSMNFAQTKEAVIACIQAKLVAFVRGSPGVGKSAMMEEIAKEYNLKLIDFRLSQADPVDLNGFPTIDPVTKTASYVPMDVFPTENTSLPTWTDDQGVVHAYAGWLLFLDEFNSASLSVQKATYKLVLDRMVGQHKLHKNVAITCAGNKDTDNAITSKLSTAMQSRLIHLDLAHDYKEWLAWAHSHQVDYRITSFINFKPDLLNKFTPDHSDATFPCQRTWDYVHRLIKNAPTLDDSHVGLLSGAIGEGAAREFIGFTRVFHDLPSIQDILANPNSAKLPTSPDTQYAVTGLLANHITAQNAHNVITYASRMPTEFTVLTMQDSIRRQPALINSDSVSDWIEANKNDIF